MSSQVITSLRLGNAHITRIFLVGSRLWGTNNGTSDFDILVVLDSLAPEIPRSQHKGQYDFTLYAEDDFVSRLKEGSFLETICSLLDGHESCVVQEGKPLRHHVQDITIVEKWVATRHAVDREKARKFWFKGKEAESFKILQYMIMAESVLRGLRGKVDERDGRLGSISLTTAELHAFIQSGRNDDDWLWFGQEWSVVEASHSDRLAFQLAASTL